MRGAMGERWKNDGRRDGRREESTGARGERGGVHDHLEEHHLAEGEAPLALGLLQHLDVGVAHHGDEQVEQHDVAWIVKRSEHGDLDGL